MFQGLLGPIRVVLCQTDRRPMEAGYRMQPGRDMWIFKLCDTNSFAVFSQVVFLLI
jgi:hypothetical protein